MRTQDIIIGETYRHKDNPKGFYGYAKAIKVLKPIRAKYAQQMAYDRTQAEKEIKHTVVKCEWTAQKNDTMGFIKYFRPCDLVKEP